MNRPKQNKEAGDSAWRLFQYCELPDKNSRENSRVIWIFFCNILEILFIYSTISHRTLVGKRCPRSSLSATNNVTDIGIDFIERVREL
jgi:hypothetical protein